MSTVFPMLKIKFVQITHYLKAKLMLLISLFVLLLFRFCNGLEAIVLIIFTKLNRPTSKQPVKFQGICCLDCILDAIALKLSLTL